MGNFIYILFTEDCKKAQLNKTGQEEVKMTKDFKLSVKA